MSTHLSNPDWYRVVYNLAALRANRAARPDAAKRDVDDLENAEQDAALIVSEGTKRSGLRRWRPGALNRERRDFLAHNVVPSAELLLAGVRLARKEEPKSPIETIDRVFKNRRVAARVHYNAACLLSTWLEHADKEREDIVKEALDHLQRFVWKADPGEAAVMGPWARKDPTLGRLREHAREEFESIFDFVDDGTAKKKPGPRKRGRRPA